MIDNVLAVAVHLDDETLGCGASLLRHKTQGAEIHWLLVTEPTPELGYDALRLKEHEQNIQRAREMYGFASIHRLGFPAARLDQVSQSELTGALASVFTSVRPSTLYLPFSHDVHSDHRVACRAAVSAAKSFRAPYLRRLLMMETVSETDFSLPLCGEGFVPNVFVDVSEYFDRKLEILSIFSKELDAHPFPRSMEHVRALAVHRGAAAGCALAEAFVLLKEII